MKSFLFLAAMMSCTWHPLFAFDLTLSNGTYFGGLVADEIGKIATDDEGNIYIAGVTQSAGLASAGAFQTSIAGESDVYLAKLTPDMQLVWCTYFGGPNIELYTDMEVTTDGIYMIGATYSLTGIASSNDLDNSLNGNRDCFISKWTFDGERIWSRYFGGSGSEIGMGVTEIGNGELIIIGNTTSTNDIATTDAAQPISSGLSEAFIFRMTTNGSILWSTYFGGSSNESVRSCLVSYDNSLIIVGNTSSTDTWLDGALSGSFSDGFILKMSLDGAFLAGHVFGGSNEEDVSFLLELPTGEMIVGGQTSSNDLPTNISSFQQSLASETDGFLFKFSANGVLIQCTYYGGEGLDTVRSLAFANNTIFAVIYCDSENISTSSNAFQPSSGGGIDMLIVGFDTNLTQQYCSFLGGTGSDTPNAILAFDTHLICAIQTSSNDLFTQPDSYQQNRAGGLDGYVCRMDITTAIAPVANTNTFVWINTEDTKAIQFEASGNEWLVQAYDRLGRLIMTTSSHETLVHLPQHTAVVRVSNGTEIFPFRFGI